MPRIACNRPILHRPIVLGWIHPAGSSQGLDQKGTRLAIDQVALNTRRGGSPSSRNPCRSRPDDQNPLSRLDSLFRERVIDNRDAPDDLVTDTDRR
jgi:hypothetical protein